MKFELVAPEMAGLFTIENLTDATSAYKHAIFFNKSANGWHTGVIAAFSDSETNATFEDALDLKNANRNEYVFGHVGYNFKSATEDVRCRFPNVDGFPEYGFFNAEIVIRRNENNNVEIGYESEFHLNTFMYRLAHIRKRTASGNSVELQSHLTRKEYISRVQSLLRHIQRGDIYEVNFCQGFSAMNTEFNPANAFQSLMELTDAPFGALYKFNNSWLICGSPERYINRTGSTVISQPIKGTRKRSNDQIEDARLKDELRNDVKERSENVMIVDLVRNDLSRIAERGTVEVAELFGIYTFKTVHQMISTVRCSVNSNVTTSDIIRNTFPMGSMTGAPKRRALQLAEEFETQSRGIYSGTVGVISPNGDFDFNVVIRSITWNAKTGYLSVMAGSAITSLSDPELEYEECMLKMEAMKRVIENA